MQLLRKLLDLILPPRCLKCGMVLSHTDGLCPDCFNQMSFISSPYCDRCGQPFTDEKTNKKWLCPACSKKNKTPFRYSRSAFAYDEFSKSLILGLKFADKTENAKILAKWMFLAGRDIWKREAEIIVPVPLHYTRLIKRRYNQSALIVRELSHLSGLPADYMSLVKSRRTKPQVEVSGQERLRNVKGAFQVIHPERLRGRRVVLVDDVLTTGATLKECALALKAAGAKSVDTLTAARVID